MYRVISEYLSKSIWVVIPFLFLTPLLMYHLRDNNRLIIIDPSNTYHISKYSSQEQLRRMYQSLIKEAFDTFLMRNPSGLDNMKLFEELYTGRAKTVAENQLKSELKIFEAYQIHQKVELLEINIIEADRERSYAQVKGQLIRSYLHMREKKTYTLSFNASLELVVNYDIGSNVKYPFLITELKYKQSDPDVNSKKD